MSKWLISWWFNDSVDGIKRGKDIIEAKEKPDSFTVMNIMDKEMEGNDYGDEKMPNFAENCNATCPNNWGVISIRPYKEKQK